MHAIYSDSKRYHTDWGPQYLTILHERPRYPTIPDQVEAAERAIPSVRHICQWVSRGKLSNMRIWRNRKRAENNHCCAELGQKTLDWTKKCVIRWSCRQSEFKLVVTKAQMTDNFMWLTNCTEIGRHFYPQSTPSHPWQRTGIWLHTPSGWHNDHRLIQRCHKITFDWNALQNCGNRLNCCCQFQV